MTSELLACPYCGTQITLPAAEADSPRVRCPRCGETFPHHRGQDGMASTNGQPEAEGSASPPWGTRSTPPGWTNRGVAAMVLAGMAVVAIVALMYALRTVEFRRSNDTKGLPPGGIPTAATAPTTTPPARLTGLGYLPAESGIVAGLHLAEMLQDKQGKELLKELQERKLDLGLALVEQKTGLKADDIDHLVLGVRPTGGLPQLNLVVQTRRPYEPAALAKAMAPTKPEKFQGRLVYRCQVGPTLSGLLYCAGERILILHLAMFGANLKDLETIPERPRPEAEAVPPPVRGLVEKRVDRESFLWAAGSHKGFEALTDLLTRAWKLQEEGQTQLAKLQAFGGGVRFQKGLTLSGSLEFADRKSAEDLVKRLRDNPLEGVESFNVVGPAPEAGDSWVSVQLRAGPEQVGKLVERMASGR